MTHQSTIRLGIVGAARILPAHMRGLKLIRDAGLADVRITAISARRLEDATMFRLRGEGPPPRPPASANDKDPLGAPHVYASDLHPETLPSVHDDWRAMLEADDVDAVLILAPVGLHHEIALDCLAAGKHVLIEKPFTISVQAAHLVVDEAEKRGLIVGVAESLRYVESVRASKWVIEQGTIGDPQMWISGGVGGEWSPDKIVARTAWRHQKLLGGGGGTIDVGVHLFHLIRYLMGPVAEISAYTRQFEPERFETDAFGTVINRVRNEVEDAFFANLRFESGAIGTTFSSWGGHGSASGFGKGSTVYGSAGSLQGDDISLDDGYHGTAGEVFTRGASPELRQGFFPGGVRDPFALEMLDFLGAIASSTPMEASGKEGLFDLATSFTVLESATANRPVSVADVVDGKITAYQDEINQHYHL